MLTGEFEREAEQNASGSEKILNDTPDLAVADSGHVDRNTSLLANPTEAIVSIAQFTEKFLEQNLSEYVTNSLSFLTLNLINRRPPYTVVDPAGVRREPIDYRRILLINLTCSKN